MKTVPDTTGGALPIDTLLDTDPRLSDDHRRVMKLLYLRSTIGTALRCEDGFLPKEIIDQLEKMRRAGLIKIVVNMRTRQFGIILTPKGDAAAWLAKHGSRRK